MSQGMPRASRSWKRQERPSLEPEEGAGPATPRSHTLGSSCEQTSVCWVSPPIHSALSQLPQDTDRDPPSSHDSLCSVSSVQKAQAGLGHGQGWLRAPLGPGRRHPDHSSPCILMLNRCPQQD